MTPSVLTSSCVIEALGSVPSDNFNVSTYTAGTVLSTRHVLTHLVFSTTPSDFCYNYNHPFTSLFIYFTDIAVSVHIYHSHPLLKMRERYRGAS